MFKTDTPFIISSLHITVYAAVCTYRAVTSCLASSVGTGLDYLDLRVVITLRRCVLSKNVEYKF